MSTYGNRLSRALDERRAEIADAITESHFAADPALDARYGATGREKCRQDNLYHLAYLAEAIAAELPALFADYVAWAGVMLAGRGVAKADLENNLGVLSETIADLLAPADAEAIAGYVEAGARRIAVEPASSADERDEGRLSPLATEYLASLLAGERRIASQLVLDSVARGMSVRDVYLDVFEPVQHEIGRLWQVNRITVAEEHYCTAATQLVMSQLYHLIFTGEPSGRTLVATCISGDLHEIGLRMVSDFFEMEGWDTYYLGANTPTASVVQSILERRADVVAISATITSHIRAVAELVAAIRAEPACSRVKVLVGGYPFNVEPELWKRIGADGCASDAEAAVAVANRLVDGSAA
jgi:methanogenic corrinoid protein MtbC1